MATLPTDISSSSKLFTLYRDPITEKLGEGEQQQGPTRPFTQWMEAVNDRLIELLFQQVVAIRDADVDALGNLADFEIGIADILRFENTVPVNLTGLVPTRTSQEIILVAAGSALVNILNESTLSQAPSNRIKTGVNETVSLVGGSGYAHMYYDGVDQRWRISTHEQGGAISVPFLAADFTALPSPATWPMTAAMVQTYDYYLRGSLLWVNVRIIGSVPKNNPTRLSIKLPSLYTAKRHAANTVFVRHDGNSPATVGLAVPALIQVDPSTNFLLIDAYNTKTGGFTGSLDVIGSISIEIGTGAFGAAVPGGGPVPPGGPGPAPGPAAPGPNAPTGPATPGPGNTPPAGLPNELALIESLAAANPVAFLESCPTAGGNWNFLDLAVAALQAVDPRWGYNGKRGDITDPSSDAIAYYYGTGAVPPADGDNNVYVVDIIGAQCGVGAAPYPAFSDVTCYDGSCLGAYIASRP